MQIIFQTRAFLSFPKLERVIWKKILFSLNVSIQAERPRLSPYIEDMKNALACALRVDPTAIGVTAGTNEGLGYVGEGKGITVYASVLLAKK